MEGRENEKLTFDFSRWRGASFVLCVWGVHQTWVGFVIDGLGFRGF